MTISAAFSPRLVVAVVLLAAAAASPGQGLGALGGSDPRGPVLVEREQVRERAVESFRSFVDGVVEESGEAADQAGVADKIETVFEEFSSQVKRALVRLEGDGLLSAQEVEEALGALRNEYESELRTVVSALRVGFAPPPLSRDFASTRQYTLALAEYAFMIRNPPVNWGTFAAWLLAGVLVAWGLNTGARSASRRLATRGFSSMGEVFESLAGPLYLAALSLSAYFGTGQLWIPSMVETTVRGAIEALLASSLFWMLWNACPGLATGITRFIRKSYQSDLDSHARNILVRVLRVLVLLGLALVIVKVILDTSLTGMLAGLGVLGLALYLILRGTLENIAASVTIFGDEPFRVGDMVIHDEQWGVIEDIGFRSTRLRTLEGHLVTIPNSDLIGTAIHNAGARPHIRRRFRLGLTYDTPPDKVREAIGIIEEILADHRGMPEDKQPHVVLENFGAYELQLLIQYYFEPPDYWQALAFDTEVNLDILARFADAGIEIAFPTQTRILAGSEHGPPTRVMTVGKDSEEASGTGDPKRDDAEAERETAGNANAGTDDDSEAAADDGRARPHNETDPGSHSGG